MTRTLASLLAALPEAALREAHAFWCGGKSAPDSPEGLVRALCAAMGDPEVVAARRRELGKKLSDLLDQFLSAPGFVRTEAELRRAPPFERMGAAEVEAAVEALDRRGIVLPVLGRSWRNYGERAFAVPLPLGEILVEIRRREVCGVDELLTLRGHLRMRIRGPRARIDWRGLAGEAGVASRLDSLPEDLRRLVLEATLLAGGVLPRSLFERLDLGIERFEPDRWKAPLERARLGTVSPLDLSRYGISLAEPTLLVFPEVVVSILRRRAREEPPSVEREATCGPDFASNLSRLLGSLVEGNVRFTAQGSVFRTTERRLAGGLIPMPTREASGEEVFEVALRFALGRRLVDRTGERTFTLSPAGLAFGALPLLEKVRRILEGFVEERGLAGEFLHQARLRRLLLRMLRRLTPGRWVEAMFLPFVARNAYLTRLDRLGVEEALTSRAPAPTAVEDPQRLAWNLFAWVRRRLHLLGLVDLGYDAASRPVALRLTPFGSRLLRPGRLPSGGERLLVNPDFEVALFPGAGDPYDTVHALDRFCERIHSDPIFRFRITEASVRLGRAEGMSTEAMVEALQGPVPQNVLFSIRAWAARAGVVRLESATLVRSEEPGVLDRFLEDPRVRERLIERISPTSALLRESPDARGMRARARDLGLRVEPA